MVVTNIWHKRVARKLTLLEFRELGYKPWRWGKKNKNYPIYPQNARMKKKKFNNSQKELIIGYTWSYDVRIIQIGYTNSRLSGLKSLPTSHVYKSAVGSD